MTALVPGKVYVKVWLALLSLLGVTWAVAQIDLAPFNAVVALTVSITKMTIIGLYFMHLRHRPRLMWVFGAAGLVWLAIFIQLVLSDYLTRD